MGGGRTMPLAKQAAQSGLARPDHLFSLFFAAPSNLTTRDCASAALGPPGVSSPICVREVKKKKRRGSDGGALS